MKGARFFYLKFLNKFFFNTLNNTMKDTKNQDVKNNLDKIDEVYKPKKKNNIRLSDFISKYVSERNLEIIMECSTFMEFISDELKEKHKQISGNSCKNRFCPLCSYRKARKDGLKILTIMKAIEELENKSFLFLTLTYKRVEAEELEDTIKFLNKSFELLFKRKEVKQMNLGYIKKLEVTYDKYKTITKKAFSRKKEYFKIRGLKVGDDNPTYNTYHPHFHIIVSVNKSYFTDKDYYISRNKFLRLWQESTGDYNITQVDVRKVNPSDDNNKVSELAKYSAKDSDYLYTEKVFDVFYKALKGKRLLTYSKIFKDYQKKYEDGELDEFKEKDKNKYMYFLETFWIDDDYEKLYTLFEDLSDGKKKRLERLLENEI